MSFFELWVTLEDKCMMAMRVMFHPLAVQYKQEICPPMIDECGLSR